ncbi:MAG UNVERIFIED_CONTAM: hypothetical protein LVR18_01110 [Planctomycetaceae bacterium]
MRVEAFGRGQTFRGVTGIVADGGDGFDYISIGPGILAPVTLIGGDRRDWLLHNGNGAATIIGGPDDDELLGGYGHNNFVFSDGFGRDTISSFSGSNDFDLSSASEDLTGSIEPSRFVLAPGGYNRRTLGTAKLGGQQVELLPLSLTVVTGLLPNHGMVPGTFSDSQIPRPVLTTINSPSRQSQQIPSPSVPLIFSVLFRLEPQQTLAKSSMTAVIPLTSGDQSRPGLQVTG